MPILIFGQGACVRKMYIYAYFKVSDDPSNENKQNAHLQSFSILTERRRQKATHNFERTF